MLRTKKIEIMKFIEGFLRGLYAQQVKDNDVTDFTTMYLDEKNVSDLKLSTDKGQLIGIVDEFGGGIIAYAIGQKNANLVQDALTVYKGLANQ